MRVREFRNYPLRTEFGSQLGRTPPKVNERIRPKSNEKLGDIIEEIIGVILFIGPGVLVIICMIILLFNGGFH